MPNLPKMRPPCAHGCGRRIRADQTVYCSLRCQREHHREYLLALWRTGRLPTRPYFNKALRRHLIEMVGGKCQRCGWQERNPSTGQVPLEIEHIDGDWQNNLPANVLVLCPNCHALTPTFRALNRGR